MGTAVMPVARRFAQWPWHSVGPRTPADIGRGIVRTAGRLTNPDGLSRWVLRRLEKLPDVAEIV